VGLYVEGHSTHRGARPDDQLLEWYWSRQDSWQVLDISAALDGQRIRGTPHGFRWLLPPDDVDNPDYNALVGSQHIVARGRHDELLEWYWLPESSWRRNYHAATGGEWMEAVLNVMMR
jgi:hypothetical protein